MMNKSVTQLEKAKISTTIQLTYTNKTGNRYLFPGLAGLKMLYDQQSLIFRHQWGVIGTQYYKR